MPEEYDNSKTAQENIDATVESAMQKRREGLEENNLKKLNALPDFGVITQAVMEKNNLEQPKLTDALKNIAVLFLGQATIDRINEMENPEEELKKLIDPFIQNLMTLLMTAVSMASAGLVPVPNIQAIMLVYKIIQEFEAAASQIGQEEEGQANERISIL
jgi:hypothetical protein